MDRRTEEPQRTHSTAANAEYKASAGIGDIIHGADGEGSQVNRSSKAADLPDIKTNDETTSEGSRGIKGWTGSGKGPLNPETDLPKQRKDL